MRQFRMIQDWSYNYLYLRHEGVVTQVNLKNHIYRDVSKSPIEEFDSNSSDNSEETTFVEKAELWVCGALCKGLKPEDVVIDRSIPDKAYVPLPFLEHQLDPQEWIHALATLSICALPKKTKFCDPYGYDIIPIRMITPVDGPKDEENEHQKEEAYILQEDMVLVRELSTLEYGSTNEGDDERCLDTLDGQDFEGDDIVPKLDLEKVRLLLKEREVLLEFPHDKPKRRFCKSHRKFRKQAIKEKKQQRCKELKDVDKEHFIPPPSFFGKNKYLYYVGAKDYVKEEVKWRYGFQLVQKVNEKENKNPKKKKKKMMKSKSEVSFLSAKMERSSITKV